MNKYIKWVIGVAFSSIVSVTMVTAQQLDVINHHLNQFVEYGQEEEIDSVISYVINIVKNKEKITDKLETYLKAYDIAFSFTQTQKPARYPEWKVGVPYFKFRDKYPSVTYYPGTSVDKISELEIREAYEKDIKLNNVLVEQSRIFRSVGRVHSEFSTFFSMKAYLAVLREEITIEDLRSLIIRTTKNEKFRNYLINVYLDQITK